MKAKIATLTIAMFMLVSLVSIIGVPLASAENDRINLVTEGNGIAEFTNLEHWLGSTSIAIIKPSYSDVAELEMTLSNPIKLKDVTSWSFWAKGGAYHVCVDFCLDNDGDGTVDKIVEAQVMKSMEQNWNNYTKEYYENKITNWKGAFLVWRGDGTGFDSYGGSNAVTKLLAKYGECEVIRVDLGYRYLSSSGDKGNETAFIDDFEIYGSGETFELEGLTQAEQVEQEKDEEIASLEQEIDELNGQITVLQDRIDELETIEIVEKEAEIASLKAQIAELESQKVDKQDQIDELNAQLGSKSATIAGLRSERNELEKDLKYWKNQPPSTRIITTGGIGEDGGQMVFAVALGAVGIAAMLCVKSFTGRHQKPKKTAKKIQED